MKPGEELKYPIGDPQTTAAGTFTYLDTRASSSSVNRSSRYDTNIKGFGSGKPPMYDDPRPSDALNKTTGQISGG